jgi:glycosyltransferase involved in cell wall biosynthesis
VSGLISSLSLVFPSYNETENLQRLLELVAEVVPLFVEDFEVIVVNDGSRDETFEVLTRLQAEHPWLYVRHHETNLGYGTAVKTGLLSATKEYLFFSDADLQFDLYYLGCLLPHLRHHVAVFGYRAPRVDPWIRKVNAWLWRALINRLFDLNVRDLDCAFKVFHRDLLKIVGRVESKGAVFSTELLLRLKLAGHAWLEIPVRHLPRPAGSSTGASPRVILRAFKELFRFYSRYRRGTL